MTKNALYFTLKALFVPEIFTFLSSFLDHAEKRLDKKATDNFKIYDVIEWTTNNDDAHIVRYL